jgi:hypothetical protein
MTALRAVLFFAAVSHSELLILCLFQILLETPMSFITLRSKAEFISTDFSSPTGKMLVA